MTNNGFLTLHSFQIQQEQQRAMEIEKERTNNFGKELQSIQVSISKYSFSSKNPLYCNVAS